MYKAIRYILCWGVDNIKPPARGGVARGRLLARSLRLFAGDAAGHEDLEPVGVETADRNPAGAGAALHEVGGEVNDHPTG